MNVRKLAVVATAVLLPLSAAACSDDSTGDLDTGDMSKELQDSGFGKAVADCMAKALKDADISEEELDAVNAGEEGATDSKAVQAYTESAAACLEDVTAPE